MARAKLLLRLLAAPPLQSPSVRSTAADRCSSHPSQSLSSRPLPNTAAPLPPPFRDLCWPLAPACGPTRCSASRSPRPCARRTGVFLPFLPARAAPSHVARPRESPPVPAAPHSPQSCDPAVRQPPIAPPAACSACSASTPPPPCPR